MSFDLMAWIVLAYIIGGLLLFTLPTTFVDNLDTTHGLLSYLYKNFKAKKEFHKEYRMNNLKYIVARNNNSLISLIALLFISINTRAFVYNQRFNEDVDDFNAIAFVRINATVNHKAELPCSGACLKFLYKVSYNDGIINIQNQDLLITCTTVDCIITHRQSDKYVMCYKNENTLLASPYLQKKFNINYVMAVYVLYGIIWFISMISVSFYSMKLYINKKRGVPVYDKMPRILKKRDLNLKSGHTHVYKYTYEYTAEVNALINSYSDKEIDEILRINSDDDVDYVDDALDLDGHHIELGH